MTVEDVMKRRDKAMVITLSFKKMIGAEAGIWNIEYFEERTNEDFREYIISEMERLGFTSMIFTGWIFTEALYNKFKEYIKYEENNKDPELFYMFFFDLNTFLVFKTKEKMIDFISKMDQDLKEDSNLNVQKISECDNGIEVKFFTRTKSYKFENKPDPLKFDYER